jgi:hypothetical protein
MWPSVDVNWLGGMMGHYGHKCTMGALPAVRGNKALLVQSAHWREVMAFLTEAPLVRTKLERRSANGRWLASRSADELGVVTLQEATTGRQIAELRHVGLVSSVAFSADEFWLATASPDSSVRVWPVSPQGRGTLIEVACERVPSNLTLEEWRLYLPEERYRTSCP